MRIDKILIVDDDFAFANRLKNGLKKFEILTAHNGYHALCLLATQRISLVVTDIDMPKLDGLELLAIMTRKFPHVVSIVSTPRQEGVLQKNTEGDSLLSYLNKPFDHIRLQSELIKVIDIMNKTPIMTGIYPASLLPLIHVSGKSCLLDIRTEGSKKGSFYFKKGVLCDAWHDNLTGREAVEEMLRWKPGKCWFKEPPELHSAKQVNGELTARIMEGTGVKPLAREQQENITVKLQPQVEPARRVTVQQKSASPKHHPRCKVLVVDDSRLIRQTLKKILSTDETLEIVGVASNGREALELIKQKKPDVVTLDIQMPVMDGLTTLKHMMIESPTPTIMLSAVALEGASIPFDTLKYGAVGFMAKPSNIASLDMPKQLNEIIHKIHLASGIKIESAKYIRSVSGKKKKAAGDRTGCKRVVCMGAAEGGYAALLKIIPYLSNDLPVAHLIMLHAIPQHVDAFINYLDRHCTIKIRRAVNGLPVEGATCYLASGKEYVSLQPGEAGNLTMQVNPAPSWSSGNSINMLMFSMAELFKEKSIGVILSGSGDDGTEGFKEIKRVGGTTIIQNPAYCLYKEMAENARKHTGKHSIMPESKIADTVNKICMQAL
jgi:two-component system chemotaxis response regulator CheB